MNWVKAHAEQLPEAPVPEEVYSVEMDELFTFIEEKKQDLHLDLCGPGHTLRFGLESEYQAASLRISGDVGRECPRA